MDTGCGHWPAGQPAGNRVMDTGLWTLAMDTGSGHWRWTLSCEHLLAGQPAVNGRTAGGIMKPDGWLATGGNGAVL